MKMLDKMLVLATTKHAGQFDRGGHPYILHPIAVMHLLRTDDEELMVIALGHDLIEDTDTTYVELQEAGFSQRVIDGIHSLTKMPGETATEYLEKVKKNRDAVLVKLADLKHNSDIERLKGVTEKDVKRMVRYHNMYLELKAVRESWA